MKTFIAALALLLSSVSAFAQTSPTWYYGFVPTPAQWNAMWSGKQDYLGYTPLSPTGVTMTGRFVAAAPTATLSGFNITPGATPSAPLNGDIWTTTAGAVLARAASVTYQINQDASGVVIKAIGVNFNLAGDTAIPVVLPIWATRYQVSGVRISNASGTLTTATAGVFTAAAGAGVAVVTAASAITVSTATNATNNNSMSMTVNNSATLSYTASAQPSLYFRIGTPQGTARTADVTFSLVPLP